MFLVHGLTTNLQYVSDRLPTPSGVPCASDVDVFESIGKCSQGANRGQSFGGICARGGVLCFMHNVRLS